MEVINWGSEEDPKEVKIGALLHPDVKSRLIEPLKEYMDIFAWSYQDMSGLDTNIVEHHLPLKLECPPIKQINYGFLVTSVYPQWIANIAPVSKKDGKVCMCVDYRDLNKASPKDDFPLPHIDMLVDSTSKFKVFSFMDGFSGYNQISMPLERTWKKQRLSHPGEHSVIE